jgi:hypothetical protein
LKSVAVYILFLVTKDEGELLLPGTLFVEVNSRLISDTGKSIKKKKMPSIMAELILPSQVMKIENP